MKTRGVVSILILVFAVLITFGSCATGKKAVNTPIEPLYGTWVNTEYNKAFYIYAMCVINPDGTIALYDKDSSTKPSYIGTYTITKKWTDDEGDIWYKIHNVIGEGADDLYELCKISDSGSIYEFVTSQDDYPTELDQNSIRYRIHYRQ